MRVALVHDYLNQYGGGERVLEALCEIWPEAPIFTLVYSPEHTGFAFAGRKIYTSFLQKVPFVRSHHRPFLMLMPLAIEQFDFSKYDLVISSTHSFAKGIITRPKTLHICYCHTPTRYVWDDSHKYIDEFNYPSLVKKFIPLFLNYLRLWDESASCRPDYYIANSEFVQKRIKKYYQQDSQIIYPPVKTSQFYFGRPGNYFLIVSRLLSYKKIDLAIKVFNKLGWPLKIIGDGPEKKRLQKLAGKNIEFVGLVDEKKLKDYFADCRAFVFPQEEDFGITAAEAMASGKPVIAYRAGGALEIIKEKETGIFFDEQTEYSLRKSLMQFSSIKFSPFAIRQHALQFDKEIFKNKILDFTQKAMADKNNFR